MQITAAEGVVMEALWRRGPLSSEDVISEVAEAQDWGPTTVKTLLARLVKKNIVAADPHGRRRLLYRPLVARSDYAQAESAGLLERLFGGRVSPFVRQFAERGALSASDLAELRQLIERLDHSEPDHGK